MSDINKVVMFTNITDKDFTHAYGGQPYSVKAGETLPFPFFLAEHLAKHLARRILIEGDTSMSTYDPKDTTGGVGKPLADDDKEAAIMAKIMGEVFDNAMPAKKTELEILQEQIAELQAKFGVKSSSEAAPIPTLADGTYKDKADVIAELKEKGIPHNPRASKESLIALLNS